MRTIVKTAAPQHNSQRLIEVLNARNKPLDQPLVCGMCYMKLRRGDSVTAVREREELLLVHDRCAGWNEPLSRQELEAAFDDIFGPSGGQEPRQRS